jgi:hypothetical protein
MKQAAKTMGPKDAPQTLKPECTGTDDLDTVLQLRLPFAWHKPDGLRGVT